jgi:hypothetical protein
MSTTGAKGTTADPTKESKKEVEDETDKIYEYTSGCYVTKKDERTVTVTWNNGKAYGATRGATIDYVPRHMFLHIANGDKSYNMASDYAAMVAGAVAPKLAWIICMVRRVAMSMTGVQVLGAETIYTGTSLDSFEVAADVMTMLTENAQVVNSIVQQTFSVLALNGQSLIQKGHHYTEEDAAYERLVTATGLDTKFTALRITNWTNALFHDALHPLDYDWVASLVVRSSSGLRERVHGVANTRMNVLPAGCTHLGLVRPLYEEILGRNGALAAGIRAVVVQVDDYIEVVKAQPLDYCAHFQRAGTAERLQELAKFEVVPAFQTGYLKKLGVKKLTVLAAKSLQGIAARHPAAYLLGEAAADKFPLAERSTEEIMQTLGAIFNIEINQDVVALDK